MKKIIVGFIVFLIFFGIGFTLGNNVESKEIDNKKVTIDRIINKTTNDFYIENGDIGIEFSDGSYAIINEEKEHYIFQPYSMDNLSYDFDNLRDFEKFVSTYLENN